MNTDQTRWFRRYKMALRKHLKQGKGANLQPALGLGRQAVALGLETLNLALIHKQALMALISPGHSSRTKQKMIKQATSFFAETIIPIEKTHRTALKTDVRVDQLTKTLHRRIMESSASTRNLKRSIIKRQAAETALRKSGKHRSKLLRESNRLQKHLRHLIRKILVAQEDERKKTSQHLQDEIAQTLLVINLRLLMLKKAANANMENLKKEIASTQRLVRKSTKKMHYKC